MRASVACGRVQPDREPVRTPERIKMKRSILAALIALTCIGMGHEASAADCNNSTYCTSTTQSGTGAAVQGVAASGVGVYGSTNTSSAVEGSAYSTGTGVYGLSSTGIGVVGSSGITGASNQPGVYGNNTSIGTGAGVQGVSYNGPGVSGNSVNVGVQGVSTGNNGVIGSSSYV